MNRTQLTEAVARDAGVPSRTVDDVLEALERQLLRVAAAGEEVKWPGLLSLDVVDRAARSGRNPQTGEALTIPAGRQVRLRPGTRLKDAARAR